jgi:hypothetical protein
MRRPWPTRGCFAIGKIITLVMRHFFVLFPAGTQFLYTDRNTGDVLKYDLSTLSSSVLVERPVLVSCMGSVTVKCTNCITRLRRLVAGLSSRRPGFDPGSVHVGFVVNKVALGQGFPRVLCFYPVNSFHRCSITWKNEKKKLIIFITGLHNKPQGFGASVASAAGPFATKKNCIIGH